MGRRGRGGRDRHQRGGRDDREHRRPDQGRPPQEREFSQDRGDFDRYRDRERAPVRNRNMPSMMRRMFLGQTAEVTIVIRTENGDAWLEELLAALRSQDLPWETETLAVDANSTDRTPLILRSRGIRTLHANAGEDFLGKVLDVAEGEVIVLLSQDTLPLKDDWLRTLVAPLFEEEKAGLTYGRVIADATVPPYPRGLISARQYVSGKERRDFGDAADACGATYFPPTNVAGKRKALQALGRFVGAGETLAKVYGAGFRKVYLPQAVTVIKGESTSQALFEALSRGPSGTRSFGRAVLDEASGLLRDIYELSDRGDLPSGQRGDAYFSALALHSDRALRQTTQRFPFLNKLLKR